MARRSLFGRDGVFVLGMDDFLIECRHGAIRFGDDWIWLGSPHFYLRSHL